MKALLFSDIKAQEAKQRRFAMKQRGTGSARAYQQQVSLVGGAAKWQITNMRQVAGAMAKWA